MQAVLECIKAARITSTKGSILLLQAASFEDEAYSDSSTFRDVGLDLDIYARKYLNRLKCTTSALYLHFDPEQSPSPVAQRNFRALQQLTELLGYGKLSLCVVSPDISNVTLQDIPAFRNALDLSLWQECLAWPHPQTIPQLATLILDQRLAETRMVPSRPVTKEVLVRTFRRAESTLLMDSEAARVRLLEDLTRLQDEHQRAQNEAQAAREELQQAIDKHDALLQRLNLRDNTEMSDIVSRFKNLNHEIGVLSRKIAQGVSDENYERYPDCTAWHDFARLQQHTEEAGEPFLNPRSRNGTGMATATFLEFYTASTICQHLYTCVFSPFYPFDSHETSHQCLALTAVYNELRLRDPQRFSAKWRVDTYSTLVKLDEWRDNHAARISLCIASLVTDVFSCIFGDQVKIEGHDHGLVKLVERALELNQKLKAEVIIAGDVHAEYFPYNAVYDDSTMQIMEAGSGDPKPENIVLTAGLGVRITKAVGGNMPPDSTVILKATVVDEQIYDWEFVPVPGGSCG